MYEKDNIGSLEVGKYADFIIVDQDPFEIERKQLKKIKVLETYVAGKAKESHGENLSVSKITMNVVTTSVKTIR